MGLDVVGPDVTEPCRGLEYLAVHESYQFWLAGRGYERGPDRLGGAYLGCTGSQGNGRCNMLGFTLTPSRLAMAPT